MTLILIFYLKNVNRLSNTLFNSKKNIFIIIQDIIKEVFIIYHQLINLLVLNKERFVNYILPLVNDKKKDLILTDRFKPNYTDALTE